MSDEQSQGPIQLKPKQQFTRLSSRPPRRITISRGMLVLVTLLAIIIGVIIFITVAGNKQKPPSQNGSKFGNVVPIPTFDDPQLSDIDNPVLKQINDKISQLQKEIANPFNYQEFLAVPAIDLNIKF